MRDCRPSAASSFASAFIFGDVVEEADGDLMGDGVNIAARLESIAKPNAICLSEQAYWQVKGRLDVAASDLGPTQLKNIAEPMSVYALDIGKRGEAAKSLKPGVLKAPSGGAGRGGRGARPHRGRRGLFF